MSEPDASAPATRRASAAAVAVISTLLVGIALTTVPTPLYPLYAANLGLTPLGVTLTFSAFAGGAVAGLAVTARFGHLVSRRQAFFLAGGLQVLAAGVLAALPTVGGFTAGRVLSGLAVGILAPSVTAFSRDIAAHLSPRSAAVLLRGVPGLTFAGLALGPLVAGLAPVSSLAGISVLYGCLAVAAACGLAASFVLLPRSIGRQRQATAFSRSVPWPLLISAFAAFSATGLFGSLTSTLLAQIAPGSGPLVTGLVTAGVFVSGAVSAIALARIVSRDVAVVLLVAGLGVVAAASALQSLPLFAVAAALTGGGSGILFGRTLGAALAGATPAEALSRSAAVLGAGYAGLALPIIGMGAALAVVPPAVAALVLTLLVAVLLVVARIGLTRRA